MKNFKFLFLALIVLAIAGVALFFFGQKEKREFQLPSPSLVEGGKEIKGGGALGAEVGTGWSAKENPREATKEAIDMALEGKVNKRPDFAIMFATSGSDLEAIFSEARKLLGNETKIYGGTTDSRAVMINKGFVKAKKDNYNYALKEGKLALAIMTISSKDIVFGVGSADFSAYPSAQEGAKSAVLSAIVSAGKSPNELPKIVLITPTKGIYTEEDTIKGIEEVVGGKTVIIGGSAGGPKWAVFGKDKVYPEGVSVAVIYTDLPVGWVFEGGFDVTDNKSGIITKVDGRNIIEIDNRPALDVYNEWLNGGIDKLYSQYSDFRRIKDLLTLHPLYRRYTAENGQVYSLFSHPFPKDQTLKERAVATSTTLNVGEQVNLSHGSWETLVNRIGNLPRLAKFNGDMDINTKSILGIGYVCAGVMGAIPEPEREKLPPLINYTNSQAPFIAPFTWGEQGHFSGIGNKHGNLLTSFIVIGPKKERR